VSSRRHPFGAGFIVAIVACIAWGALAFGAVYAWAFVPLAIGCATCGAVALLALRPRRPPLRALAAAFAFIGAAIAAQIVPLPGGLIDRVSPRADVFVAYSAPGLADVADPSQPEPTRAISIDPSRTELGLGLFCAFALFALGVSRVASVTGGRPLAATIVVFGIFMAVVGIAQHELTLNDKHPLIYGFWKAQGTAPFGPFVNPNHFGGWMLMATSLALAMFLDGFQVCVALVATRRDDRRSLLGTPELGASLLFGGAYLVMALSLLMTRSRSALGAFMVAGMVAAVLVNRRQASRRVRLAMAAGFAALMFGSVAWAGLDTTISKFVEANRDGSSVTGRLSAWRDTVRIVRDFPLTGTGLNTYGIAMELYQTERSIHFQEAHNDYLQIAAEGGLLLAVPIVVALVIFARTVRRRFDEAPKQGATYWVRVGAVLGLVAIALQSLLEFSLQMPGNAALFAVLVGLTVHQSPNLRPEGARS
jgi:O-antigen ligase